MAAQQRKQQCNTFGMKSLTSSCGSLEVLAGGTGEKSVAVLQQGHVQNPYVTAPAKMAAERCWYLACKVSWRCRAEEEPVVLRAGRPFWNVMTCHLNHTLAKKRDASKAVLQDVFKVARELQVDLLGGDFNACGTDGTALELVKEAMQGCVIHECKTEDDCIRLFVVDRAGDLCVNASSSYSRDMTAADMWLRPGDHDWHLPIVAHIRVATERSKRNRAESTKRERKHRQDKRRKQRKRAALAKAAAGPADEATEVLADEAETEGDDAETWGDDAEPGAAAGADGN